jgi:DNA-binding Lrp family transcriptional regulator
MHESIAVDRFDLRLMAALEGDGRLTNQELGERIGLSASQCSRRRSALETAGLIVGYRAELAAEALGLKILVFIEVNLAQHSPENGERFRNLLNRIDEIQEAYALSGDTDYMLKAIVPDLKSLSSLINDTLLGHSTVSRVCSSIVLDRLKMTTRLPLATVEAEMKSRSA